MTRFLRHAAYFGLSAVVGMVGGCLGGLGGTGNPAGLTASEIMALTNGQAIGPVSVSPDGKLLAYSNGQNILTVDLTDPNLAPLQVTNQPAGVSAFTPNFLNNGQLVFGTLNPLNPDQFLFLSASPGTLFGSPVPATVGTLTAQDLGLGAGTALTAPTDLSLSNNGTLGVSTINNSPFMLNFGGTSVSATPLTDVFGEPISNMALSPNGSQLAFTNSSGQVGLAPLSNGTLGTPTLLGNGTFPSFTPTGQLAFFGSDGLNVGTLTGGFNTFGLGAGFTPSFPVFSPLGNSFFMSNGSSFLQSTLPGSAPF
jgi:hypothetical protein